MAKRIERLIRSGMSPQRAAKVLGISLFATDLVADYVQNKKKKPRRQKRRQG